jgi:hypothetical protein
VLIATGERDQDAEDEVFEGEEIARVRSHA